MKKHKMLLFIAGGIICLLLLLTVHALSGRQMLFQIHSGGGYGTEEMTFGTEYTVYANGTLAVRHSSHQPRGLRRIRLSDQDFETLKELTAPEAVEALDPGPSAEVCDGGSRYLRIYGKNNQLLITKGGYEPSGEEFLKLYSQIKAILAPYDKKG